MKWEILILSRFTYFGTCQVKFYISIKLSTWNRTTRLPKQQYICMQQSKWIKETEAHEFKANSSGCTLHHGNPTFPFHSRRRKWGPFGHYPHQSQRCHRHERALLAQTQVSQLVHLQFVHPKQETNRSFCWCLRFATTNWLVCSTS